MALSTLYTPPKNAEELEKRKVLASALKDFAAGSSPETVESLAAQGEKIGVTRNQLSNLYNQYKKQGVTATPLSAPPEAASPPSSLAAAPTSPAQTPSMAQGSGSVFDQQEKVAQAASAASGAFGGPNSRGASSQYQAPTPRLDRLAAMQGTPMGSVSIGASGVQGATGGLAKGRSRTGGTPLGGSSTGFSPFGGGTSSAKMMNNIASANLYFAAAERQRQLKEQEAEERGFNRANGNAAPNPMGGIEGGSEYRKMPYFYTQQAK